MKYSILFLSILVQGCASLSDAGAFTETYYTMPDMTKHTFVERTKMNLVVPSTHMIYKYVEVCGGTVPPLKPVCKMVEYSTPALLAQDGIANDVIVGVIRAGSLVGSTVYAADKALEAGQAIGDGLSRSGNTTTVTGVSSSKATATARSRLRYRKRKLPDLIER